MSRRLRRESGDGPATLLLARVENMHRVADTLAPEDLLRLFTSILDAGSNRRGACHYATLDRPLLGYESVVIRIGSDPTHEYRLPLAGYDPDHPETLRQDLVIPAPSPSPFDNAADTK